MFLDLIKFREISKPWKEGRVESLRRLWDLYLTGPVPYSWSTVLVFARASTQARAGIFSRLPQQSCIIDLWTFIRPAPR